MKNKRLKIPLQLNVSLETICPIDKSIDVNHLEIRFIQTKTYFVELIELSALIQEYSNKEIFHEELVTILFKSITKKFSPVKLQVNLSAKFETLNNMELTTYLHSSFKNTRTPCPCEFCWKFKKEPRLGKNHLSLIEALADSAQQLLVNDSLDGVYDRINRILTICRNIIRSYPEDLDQPRCRYRVNLRMRCNLPLINNKCIDHGYKPITGSIDDYF